MLRFGTTITLSLKYELPFGGGNQSDLLRRKEQTESTNFANNGKS